MTTELDKLGGRWQKEMRLRFVGDEALGRRFIGLARQQVGEMEQQRHLAGITFAKVVRSYANGVIITTMYDGVMRSAEINTQAIAAKFTSVVSKPALWIPRGFVLYPATDAVPNGWGLPVKQITTDDGRAVTPYDALNTNPGLDVARWTEGGYFGQVLLTKDIGYPKANALVTPLAFSKSFGPKLKKSTLLPPPDPTLPYVAHRVRLSSLGSSQSPGATPDEANRIVQFKRGIFERINTHRNGIGRDPLSLPIFGYYDSAQITAEIDFQTFVIGHFSDRFPSSFRTPEDRVSKDDVRSTVLVYPSGGSPNSRDYNQEEIAFGNAIEPTTIIGVDPNGIDIIYAPNGGSEVTATQAFNGWISSPHHRDIIESPILDVAGMHGAVMGIGLRGNIGIAHLKREEAWLTCGNRVFDCPDGLSPISWHGPPSLNLAWETFPCSLGATEAAPLAVLQSAFSVNSDVEPWLAFYATASDYRQAWQRGIYTAGRCIAIAPGLVWAAAVRKIDEDAKTYRIIALVHNESDQPSNKTINGMTRYLRVYWCDVPIVGDAVLSPGAQVRGIYGSESTDWPWDEFNYAYSWKGGDFIDVGSVYGDETDLLKYRSQWVFNADATKAVCMRDYGPLKSPSGNPTVHRGYSMYRNVVNGGESLFSDGLYASTVTLTFNHAPDDVTFSVEIDTPLVNDDRVFFEPIAAAFNADGDVVYAYRYVVGYAQFGETIAANPHSPRFTTASIPNFTAVGVGPRGVISVDELTIKYEQDPSDPQDQYNVQVLDIPNCVFIIEKTANAFCFVQTEVNTIEAELIIGGELAATVLAPNPTNAWVRRAWCGTEQTGDTYNYAFFDLASACVVQGFYYRNDGDHIAGLMVSPQPQMLRAVDEWPVVDGNRCLPLAGRCMPTVRDYINGRWTTVGDYQVLGHAIVSSIPSLQALVGTPGDGFRSLYAGRV